MQNYSMSRRRFLTVAGSTVILAGFGRLGWMLEQLQFRLER